MSDEQVSEQNSGDAQRVQNPDGTTNWAVVFEDPEQGILAAVEATGSAAQLRAVMKNVALLLFKRKRDAEPRAEFLAKMERIIDRADENGFESVQSWILQTLNAEKQMRIEKAALHAQNKLTSQSIERRRASTKLTPFESFINSPLLLGGSVVVLLSLIAVIVGLVLMPADAPLDEQAAAMAESQNEPKPTEATEKQPPKVKPEPRPNPRELELVVLKPITNEVLVRGQRRRMALVPMIRIEKSDSISDICALRPWLIESVLLNVNAVTEAGNDADAAAIKSVSAKVFEEINRRSSGTKLRQLYLFDLQSLPRNIVLAANRGCGRVKMEIL